MSGQPDVPLWRRGLDAAMAAPRCRAKRKHGRGPCRGPAVKGRPTCRMHGGTGGAPKGERNGRWRHGRYSGDTIEARREARAIIRAIREMVGS